MGVVMRATHMGLNQPVALKFLTSNANVDPAVAAERFLREARATFRLRSENTVRMLDAGTLPSGAPVMVMELLEGMDLKALIAERGPLPAVEAVQYAIQICDALGEAHALGVVHRDLKARNVFVTKRSDGSPCVKVLDFGISKVADEGDGPLTAPDMALGSPRYMAPEQWQSAATVDARADIYALGTVIYEMLTGRIPLAGLPLEELIKRIAAGAIPSPRELRPDLSEPLCRVVLKALRPHPDERYPTAAHFAAALRDAVPVGAGGHKPKLNFAMTAPTAVMNHEALLAQQRIAQMGAPSQAPVTPAPSTDETPLSSTLDEAPAATPVDISFDDKTAVSEQGPAPQAPPPKVFGATMNSAAQPITPPMQGARAPAPPTPVLGTMQLPDAVPATPPMAAVSPYAPAPATSPMPMAPPGAGIDMTQRSSYAPPQRVSTGGMPAYGPPPSGQLLATRISAPPMAPRMSSPVPAPPISIPPAPRPAPPSSRRSLWWIFAVVLILGCAAIGLALGFALFRAGATP